MMSRSMWLSALEYGGVPTHRDRPLDEAEPFTTAMSAQSEAGEMHVARSLCGPIAAQKITVCVLRSDGTAD